MNFALKTFAAVLAIAALGISAPLSAHAELVRSTPAARANVAAPRTISLTFSERVVPAFSSLELTMAGHDMKVAVTTRVSRDGKTLIGTPQRALMKGSWSLKWVAATGDGHRMTGTIPFRVR